MTIAIDLNSQQEQALVEVAKQLRSRQSTWPPPSAIWWHNARAILKSPPNVCSIRTPSFIAAWLDALADG